MHSVRSETHRSPLDSAECKPEDIKIRGGIIDKKGMKYYIEEKELLWHDFDLKECGDYQVFIENISDVSIQIYGFYN